MTAIPSREANVPSRKDFRNINLHVKRLTHGGVEFGVAAVPLDDSNDTAGIFSWRNMENARIIVERVIIDLTTKSSAASTIDVGVAATEISDDTLLDGIDTGAAVNVFDSIKDAGTNGGSARSVAQGSYVTGTQASGAVAGLAGIAYIFWIKP